LAQAVITSDCAALSRQAPGPGLLRGRPRARLSHFATCKRGPLRCRGKIGAASPGPQRRSVTTP
jgi:hypothetical protein